MSSANKAKGSKWERDIEEYCNTVGLKARRLPRAGAKDIGDVSIELKSEKVIVCEAKNRLADNMALYLHEAEVEANHYEEKYGNVTYPVVIRKARGKGTGDGRVTMTLDTLINLLKWENLT